MHILSRLDYEKDEGDRGYNRQMDPQEVMFNPEAPWDSDREVGLRNKCSDISMPEVWLRPDGQISKVKTTNSKFSLQRWDGTWVGSCKVKEINVDHTYRYPYESHHLDSILYCSLFPYHRFFLINVRYYYSLGHGDMDIEDYMDLFVINPSLGFGDRVIPFGLHELPDVGLLYGRCKESKKVTSSEHNKDMMRGSTWLADLLTVHYYRFIDFDHINTLMPMDNAYRVPPKEES